MNLIYLLITDGNEWEDIVVFLTEEHAINESIKNPKSRVEIFIETDKNGYIPTYNYYKNGKYIQKL
jgi:hypothetical protein